MKIRYIEDPAALEAVGEALSGTGSLALDCEAAGYHRYSDRLCLLQLTVGDTTFLIDPLAVDPGTVLGAPLSDPRIEVIMHGADFDIRLLDRDLRVGVSGLVDTQIAAALLGAEAVGLSALVEARLGVRLSKKYQKADWAERPLSEPMLTYAAHDTLHLPILADALMGELDDLGRVEWAREEFRELEKVRFEPEDSRDPVLRVRAARGLSPREVDRLREALGWRDDVAREMDRAVFRVVGDPVLIEAVRQPPSSVEELERLPGMNRSVARRHGNRLLDRLREVERRPDAELAGYPSPIRRRNGAGGRPLPEVEERLARLKEVRNARAEELGIARGTLLSNGILQSLAESPPRDLPELSKVGGIRRWQAEILGEGLLAAL